MLSLLIVDDEIPILNGLKHVVENGNTPFKTILCADNGEDAMHIAVENPIALIITDICMPEMDGLTLIENIQKRGLCSKFIILTGYGQFDYAKQAIGLNVIDYLLKPVNSNDLLKLLEDIAKKIEVENYRKNKMVELQLKNTLLYDEDLDTDLLENTEIDGVLPHGYCHILIMKTDSENNSNSLSEDIVPNLVGAISQNDLKVYFFSQQHSGLYIYLINTRYELSVTDADNLCYQMKQIYSPDKNVYFGISSQANIGNNLHRLYLEALKATLFNSLVLKTGITPYVNIRNDALDKYYENLGKKFENINGHTVLQEFGQEFDALTEGHLNDLDYVNKISTNIIFHIYIYMEKRGADLNKIAHKYILEYNTCKHIDKIKSNILSIVKSVHNYLWEGRNTTTSDFTTLERVKNYIHEHYSSDISLDVVAEHLNLHPNYISTLFKSKTGVTFIQYLNNYRIDQAKRYIMQEPLLSLREIGQKVGFANENNFYKTFKKITKMTPGMFRS